MPEVVNDHVHEDFLRLESSLQLLVFISIKLESQLELAGSPTIRI